MNKNAKAWVAALRSGDYSQGRERLHTVSPMGEHHFCCLGVACDLAAKEGIVSERRLSPRSVGTVVAYYNVEDGRRDCWRLLSSVQEWLGMIDNSGDVLPTSLVELNDQEAYSFEQIADEIVANAKVLFVDDR